MFRFIGGTETSHYNPFLITYELAPYAPVCARRKQRPRKRVLPDSATKTSKSQGRFC